MTLCTYLQLNPKESAIKLKEILIIGGAGFVGSCLAARELGMGNRVIILDNLFTGSRDNVPAGAEFIYGCSGDLAKFQNQISPDYVYHFGEYSRVEQSFDEIDFVMRNNCANFPSVLEFCKIKKAKLIYSGSSTQFVNGIPVGSLSPYTMTKYQNIKILEYYASVEKLNYAITYFYNVFGEKEISSGAYATVVAKFLRLRKQGIRDLPVNGTGKQRRNFTHISDIVEGLILVSRAGSGDGYGIGNPKSYSILELVKMLKCEPIFKEDRPGNRQSADLKIDKLIDLGWQPKVDLETYLKRALL